MAAHVQSTFPPVDIPDDLSIPAFVLQDAAKYGNRPAFIDASTGKRLSYSALVTKVQRLAIGLYRQIGRFTIDQPLEPGPTPRRPVVCLYSRACLEFPVIVHAVLLAGATVTTADSSLSTDELTRQFEILLPDFVFADHDKVDDARFAASRVGSIKEVFVLGKYLRGHISIDELLNSTGRAPLNDVTVDYKNDVTVVPFEADNRGQLKGIMHSHHSFNANVAILGCPDVAPISRDDIVCCCHRMSSMVGLTFYCGLVLREGATAVILPEFSNNAALEAINKYRVSVLHVTPGVAEFLSSDLRVPQSKLSTVRRIYCTGDPLKEEVIRSLSERPGVTEVREGFGPGEAPAILSVPRGDTLPGYVGQVCPNTEVQIRDILFGGVVESETYGEVCVYGPQIMLGHLCKLDPVREAVKDGWLRTGHIGQIDQSANFSLLGRMDDLISYDSFNISPIELENVIRQHPDVDDTVVVGMDNHGAGHVPRAYVIKVPDADIIEADIYDYVADLVENHKKLRGGVVFVEDVPRSVTGEPVRYELQAEANRGQFDISLGECVQWPPDGDCLNDMRLLAARDHRASIWDQIAEIESLNFSGLSGINDQFSGIFSHSSLKFDDSLDGFITTRNKEKTKTPETNMNITKNEPIPTSHPSTTHKDRNNNENLRNLLDSSARKDIGKGKEGNKKVMKSEGVGLENFSSRVKKEKHKRKEGVRWDIADSDGTEEVERGGGEKVGAVLGREEAEGPVRTTESFELSTIAIDCQLPMSTSTPKRGPILKKHVKSPEKKTDLSDSNSIPSFDQSHNASKILRFSEKDADSLKSGISGSLPVLHRDNTSCSLESDPNEQSKKATDGKPKKTEKFRRRETTLQDAMGLEDGTTVSPSNRRRNLRSMGGNAWKSTGDLSALAKELEEESPVKSPDASSRMADAKFVAAQNIRHRAKQYGEQIRKRQVGLHRNPSSSYMPRDTFSTSYSETGRLLYIPNNISTRSKYLTSTGYNSFSLTNRFDLV